MTLKLTNNVTKSVQTLSGLTDSNTSRMFYSFSITLPSGMDDGEYTYELMDNDVVKSQGLLQIGDYIPQNTTYTNDNNTYKQYEG